MIIDEEDYVDYIEHVGVKGMKWGVRRNPKTGIRPIAKTLNDSRFGRAAQKNVDRHDRRVANKGGKSHAEAVGRGAATASKATWKGAKAVGRGTKKTAVWANQHRETAAAIALGSAYVAMRLNSKVKGAQANRAAVQASRMRIKDIAKASQTAKGSSYAAAKAKAFKAIPLGPIGSTSTPRLNGGIPMPKMS